MTTLVSLLLITMIPIDYKIAYFFLYLCIAICIVYTVIKLTKKQLHNKFMTPWKHWFGRNKPSEWPKPLGKVALFKNLVEFASD